MNARLENILAMLDPAAREVVEAALASPAERACRGRRAARDEALRAAAKLFDDNAATLSHELARYLARTWPRERELETLAVTATARRAALHRIARLDDQALSTRQIRRIIR